MAEGVVAGESPAATTRSRSRARIALVLAAVSLAAAVVGSLGPATEVRSSFSWPPRALPAANPTSSWYAPLLLESAETRVRVGADPLHAAAGAPRGDASDHDRGHGQAPRDGRSSLPVTHREPPGPVGRRATPRTRPASGCRRSDRSLRVPRARCRRRLVDRGRTGRCIDVRRPGPDAGGLRPLLRARRAVARSADDRGHDRRCTTRGRPAPDDRLDRRRRGGARDPAAAAPAPVFAVAARRGGSREGRGRELHLVDVVVVVVLAAGGSWRPSSGTTAGSSRASERSRRRGGSRRTTTSSASTFRSTTGSSGSTTGSPSGRTSSSRSGSTRSSCLVATWVLLRWAFGVASPGRRGRWDPAAVGARERVPRRGARLGHDDPARAGDGASRDRGGGVRDSLCRAARPSRRSRSPRCSCRSR